MTYENLIRVLILLFMAVSFTISGYYRKKADQSSGKTDFSEENRSLFILRSLGALLLYGRLSGGDGGADASAPVVPFTPETVQYFWGRSRPPTRGVQGSPPAD